MKRCACIHGCGSAYTVTNCRGGGERMRRRAARRTQAKAAYGGVLLRLPIEAVYGGVVPGRGERDEALGRLAASIARHGLLEPIVVRRSLQADHYAVVCGARRLAACRMLGMAEIDALCVALDAEEAAVCFVEAHALQSPPNAMEEARALAPLDRETLLEYAAQERGTIERRLRLLALPEQVQEIVRRRRLTLEQIEPLLCACGEERQTEAALIIAERALTPAQARRLVFGPERGDRQSGRRRSVRAALEEVNAIARRMRAQGVEASVSVHAQREGMCVQILFAQKQEGRQEFACKGEK